jgi:hypothetical protein
MVPKRRLRVKPGTSLQPQNGYLDRLERAVLGTEKRAIRQEGHLGSENLPERDAEQVYEADGVGHAGIRGPPWEIGHHEIAEAFGKYVGKTPIKSQFAVFSRIVGTPKAGVGEIQTIVVDKSGKKEEISLILDHRY